jgi:methionine-gamma-lyase
MEPGFSTRAIHGAKTPPIDQETPSVPIFQTSTFRFDTSEDYAETIAFRKDGYTYSRGYGNPTVQAFENVMAELEGTETAFAFASGRIVASTELYGGAYSLFTKVLPRFGIETTLVDPHDHAAIAAALPGAALFYVETLANPTVTVADLPALGALCRDAGVPAAVDNTVASPYLCTPAPHGFAYVLHSATKYIGGHNDLIGGVVCTDHDGRARLRDLAIEYGGTMAPFEAWLSMRGLVTLALRMDQHTRSAGTLASALERHGKVERVWYPGLASHPQHEVAGRVLKAPGGMLAFELVGGIEAGQVFCDSLDMGWVATSLGGAHTLVGHAASTTHRQMDPEARRAAGIGDGLVRVSAGLEDTDDIVEDFLRALEKV